MALRIAMVAYTHYESDPRVRREAEALAARGDDVHVWCLASDEYHDKLLEGVNLHRIEIPRYRGGKAAAYLRSYSRFFVAAGARMSAAHIEARFDILHVHTMPDFMVFTGVLPKLAGAKVVLDMHDLMPDLYAVKFGLKRDGRAVRWLRRVQNLSAAFADAVICVHEPQYELLLRDGVPPRKLNIVMNAPDPKLFAPRKKEPRIKEDGQIRLVYHGTVLHRYGVDLAVRAFAKARQREPRLVMSILGDGDFLPEIQRLAEELHLGPDVLELPGRRFPLSEIAEKIRSAHIGIIPNRDDQEDSVLPTKLLEYVSVGIPAVATNTRCIGRYFSAEQLELVPVGNVEAMADAIVRLATDKELRKTRVAAARAWEEEFGYATQMRLLFRIVDNLCLEKVLADKRKRQESLEGVKTGTRVMTPKPPKSAAAEAQGAPADP